MAPKLSAFSSKITQNEALFARVKAVYEGKEMETLRLDQQRVVQLTYDGFARNGATLDADDKKRYAANYTKQSVKLPTILADVIHLILPSLP